MTTPEQESTALALPEVARILGQTQPWAIRDFIAQSQQHQLETGLDAQRAFWKFIGIFALVSLVLSGVAMLVALVLGGVAGGLFGA